ncbi:MAG: short-chain dehydrogenase [Deltaproteobacteria bacterium]|jgi:NAD(P)-dependent dehydrogenase (short-subunit alcohol dehydrogenase family)|nr:short-chain dehydrogenase [Deltaproteobacteria bacterium]
MGLLNDRVAVLAGVGVDLGTALARVFAAEGADLVLAARSEDIIRTLAGEIEGMGRKCIWQCTDITDAAACRSLVARAEEELGGIDILVNNAVWPHGEGPLADANLEDWRTAMEVNFLGAMTMTQAAIPALRRRTAARIIMVSTIASREHYAMAGPYASSKAALNAVTKTLARELGPDGIRVNAVIPGWIWGPTAQGVLKQWGEAEGVSLDDMRIRYEQQTALHYLPDAEEVAKVAVFLASELSNPVTGHLLDANAGQWM